MLLTRWFKHHHFMNNNVRKYLGYAAGEIVLLIVGILIALQINAWYEDRKIRDNLSRQLQRVAESISQDLVDIARLKQHRTDAIFAYDRQRQASIGQIEDAERWYNREFVETVSNLIADSQVPVSFVANTGAYRVLESSSHANHIDSDGLKSNLHDYYATVERIVFAEREANNYSREVTFKYQTESTRGLYKPFLHEPLMAWSGDNQDDPFYVEFRELYLELLNDTVTQALIRSGRSQQLLKEYEHLLSLGNALILEINAYIDDGQRIAHDFELLDIDGVTGPARVFQLGRFEAHSLGLFISPHFSSFGTDIGALKMRGDHLRVTYRGGDNWAFLYSKVGSIDWSNRVLSLDYSRFDRIRLVLKRHSGCEDLRLVLKDAEDANDGTQVNVRLDLSDDWATYEYDLSLFSDADLGKRHAVSGFLMLEAPCSFSIRDVTFLEPEQTPGD
jgi:hypothetical protein